VSHHAIETLIIGAGAAGLFCAAQLAKCGGKVRILDNGKKEDKTTAKSYFQRSCELGFKKGCDMRNLLDKLGY